MNEGIIISLNSFPLPIPVIHG